MNGDRNKNERKGIHTHIKGLGESEGLIGQEAPRKALLIIKKLLKNGKSGQIILLEGPSESGKTALIQALKKEIKEPFFNNLNASEFRSLHLSKTEMITQALRKSIHLRIKETIKVVEGEVTSINYTKIGLKTLDMESTFDIGENMQKQIEKEKIVVGDVIRIVKERGNIIKLGISSSKVDPNLLGDLVPVNCPEGEMFKVVEEIQNISLHEIDALNNKTNGYLGIYNGEIGEINYDVRKEVNEKIKKWILEGKVEVERGVLNIEDVHLLDNDCISFLNKSAESNFCPIIILTTNKDASDLKALFKYALVVSTESYKETHVEEILRLRITDENIKIEEQGFKFLVQLANKSGLKYVMNILSICNVRNLKNGATVTENDVKNIVGIFLDAKRAFYNY
jgi:RuvB-like protein 2